MNDAAVTTRRTTRWTTAKLSSKKENLTAPGVILATPTRPVSVRTPAAASPTS